MLFQLMSFNLSLHVILKLPLLHYNFYPVKQRIIKRELYNYIKQRIRILYIRII